LSQRVRSGNNLQASRELAELPIEIQLPLIRALEKRKFTVIPLQYRHGRTFGGSWHCIIWIPNVTAIWRIISADASSG